MGCLRMNAQTALMGVWGRKTKRKKVRCKTPVCGGMEGWRWRDGGVGGEPESERERLVEGRDQGWRDGGAPNVMGIRKDGEMERWRDERRMNGRMDGLTERASAVV